MSSRTSSSELDGRVSSSVLELTQECMSLLEGCAGSSQNERSSAMETRLADFRLWADGIGAISEGTGSLNYRSQIDPDDLFLLKTILIMLADFVADYSALLADDQPIGDAVERIDSTIENLAMISASIKQPGKVLRRQGSAPRFDSRDYEDLRRHLECVILLRPSKSGLQTELNPLHLSIVQKRLIEANIQRRHRFVIAQRGFRKLEQRRSRGSEDERLPKGEKPSTLDGKEVTSQATNPSPAKSNRMLEAALPAKEHVLVPTKEPLAPERKVSGQGKADRTPHKDLLLKKERKDAQSQSKKPLRTIAKDDDHQPSMSTRSSIKAAFAGDETLKTKEKRTYAPGRGKAHIIPLATAAEFPRPPPNLKGRRIGKCPCCCQEIPVEEMVDSSSWRKHIEKDLLPYTCIIEDCPIPQAVLFGTREEWKTHVQTDHRSHWYCPLCDETNILMDSEEAIVHHFKTEHQSDLKRLTLETLLSWSKKKVMGVTSCPLCYSYGREDSPELIDHVLRHVYEFSLRALPWTKPAVHSPSKGVGNFSLPQHEKLAETFLEWLEGVENESVAVPQLPALEASSSEVDISEVIDDTGYVPDEEYFDTRWMSDFSGQSSLSFGSSHPFIAGSPNQVIPAASGMRGVDDREDDDRKPETQAPEDSSPPGGAGSTTLKDNCSQQHLLPTQPQMPPLDDSSSISTSLIVDLEVSLGVDSATRRVEAYNLWDERLDNQGLWLLGRDTEENLIVYMGGGHFPLFPNYMDLGPDLDSIWSDDTIHKARARLEAAGGNLSAFKSLGAVENQAVKGWLEDTETSGNAWLLGVPCEPGLSEDAKVIIDFLMGFLLIVALIGKGSAIFQDAREPDARLLPAAARGKAYRRDKLRGYTPMVSIHHSIATHYREKTKS